MKLAKALIVTVLGGLLMVCVAVLFWKVWGMRHEVIVPGQLRVTMIKEDKGEKNVRTGDQEAWLFTSADAYKDYCRENGKESYPSYGKSFFSKNVLILWQGRVQAWESPYLQALYRQDGSEGILELLDPFRWSNDLTDYWDGYLDEACPVTAVFTELPRTSLKGADSLEVTVLTDIVVRNGLYAEKPLLTKGVQELVEDYQSDIISFRKKGRTILVHCPKAPAAGESPALSVAADLPEIMAWREQWGVEGQPTAGLFLTSVIVSMVFPEDYTAPEAMSVFFRREGKTFTMELIPYPGGISPYEKVGGRGPYSSFAVSVPRILLSEAESLQVLLYGAAGEDPISMIHSFR